MVENLSLSIKKTYESLLHNVYNYKFPSRKIPEFSVDEGDLPLWYNENTDILIMKMQLI